MAFQSGHTGELTTPAGLKGEIRSWELNDVALLHDTSVLGNNTRRRTAGIKDWRATLDVFVDDAAVAADFTPGTLLTDIQLTINLAPAGSTTPPAGDPADFYKGPGIIESFAPAARVDDAIRGQMIVQANGDLVRTYQTPT